MNNRVLYAVLTLLFNSIGVPCFMQGKVGAGILRIVLGAISCSVIYLINFIMGIIAAIKVFKMTDDEFAAIADKTTLLMGVPSGKNK